MIRAVLHNKKGHAFYTFLNQNTEKIMRYLLLAFWGLVMLGGCGIPQKEYDKLKLENTLLLNENEGLKKELEECRFGAERLLNQATTYFQNGEYEKCKSTVTVLLLKHSGSQEAVRAKELLAQSNAELNKIALAKEEAEKEQRRKEEQRLANATKKMRENYDDIRGISWYYDKSSPQYVDSRTNFHAYIGKKSGSPWLRLVIQYVADDWLFIEKYIIKVDGRIYEINENKYGEIETDNGGGDIWEWLDRIVGPKEFQIIKAVAYGKDVKIRFQGKKYRRDRTVTNKEKMALRNVLDAYEALGGKVY